MCGRCLRSRAHASMPLIVGMRRSIRTATGFVLRATSTASRPVPAEATTSGIATGRDGSAARAGAREAQRIDLTVTVRAWAPRATHGRAGLSSTDLRPSPAASAQRQQRPDPRPGGRRSRGLANCRSNAGATPTAARAAGRRAPARPSPRRAGRRQRALSRSDRQKWTPVASQSGNVLPAAPRAAPVAPSHLSSSLPIEQVFDR